MAALDNLPPDQRAVLQLVLQRGRSYDEIAKMLSIDRAGVRDRALQAFDALGPSTRVPPERRALITDYLLGQLPSRVADDTRARLSESASERAWARVIASELAPLKSDGSLPEIPTEAGGRAPAARARRAPAPAPRRRSRSRTRAPSPTTGRHPAAPSPWSLPRACGGAVPPTGRAGPNPASRCRAPVAAVPSCSA